VLQVIAFVHAIELCNQASRSQALCFLVVRISPGCEMDSKEIPSRETMVTSVVPSGGYQPRCYFVIASHTTSVMHFETSWQLPRKCGPECCKQASGQERVCLFCTPLEKIRLRLSSQTAPGLAARFFSS